MTRNLALDKEVEDLEEMSFERLWHIDSFILCSVCTILIHLLAVCIKEFITPGGWDRHKALLESDTIDKYALVLYSCIFAIVSARQNVHVLWTMIGAIAIESELKDHHVYCSVQSTVIY